MKCHFASDNVTGLLPEVLAAIQGVNDDYMLPYGDDEVTAAAAGLFRRIFATECEVFFVFNGTAANSLALASLCQSYHSVIVHNSGHVETDECGGPEFFSNGTKLLLAGGEQGKFNLDEVRSLITKRNDIHFPRPRALTFSQPTELGTVYQVAEVQALCALAKEFKLKVHIDGARFAQAVAATQAAPSALTWEAGVAVLSFGGTKAGGLSEAVVFFDLELAAEFDYRCKQAGQLASKMRLLAAPWVAVLEQDLWLKYARHANDCAQKLRAALAEIPGIEFLHPTEANAVFVTMPEVYISELRRRGWYFYVFIGGGARLMCSWKTTEADIAALLDDLVAISRSPRGRS